MQLNQCINYLLTTSQHVVFQKTLARLSEYDITPVQYGALYCLWELHLDNPKEIAAALHLENSTISGVLDRLEKKEFIERGLNPNDRRCVKIKLTRKAASLRLPVLQAVDRLNEEILSVFTEEEADHLKACLRRLSDL